MDILKMIEDINKGDNNKDDGFWSMSENEELEIERYHVQATDKEQSRIQSYYLSHWYCTDTWVGMKVYFFDDEPICVSYQPARKDDEEFSWISKESFNKVKDFYISLYRDKNNIDLINLEEEYGEGYNIEYSEQLLSCDEDNIYYNNEKVEIIEKRTENGGFDELKRYIPSLVKIRLQDDSEEWLEIRNLTIKWHLKESNKNG